MAFAEWFVLALTVLFLAYFAYATPIILVGIWHYRRHGFGDDDPGEDWDPPNVSVLVPVKNEERVVRRLLTAMTRLEYPRENLEVIVVEDGSKDGTLDICREFSQRLPWVKVYHRETSN